MIALSNVCKQYGRRVLLVDASFQLNPGEKVGLVGPNGAGKTTLLDTLLGQRPAASGSARLGLSTTMASYRQDFAQVPRDKTLFDIIHDLRPTWTRGQVMDQLGRYDFSADRSLRRADSLSGGELARVALAMMTLIPVNFLIFDEPTNHLDVESIEALEDAIEAYEGTVLLVSHDRALLDALCTRIWALEEGVLHDFDGGFEEWFEARAARRSAAASAARKVETDRREKEKQKQKKAAPPSHAERKAQQSAERSARRNLEQAEALVHQLEQRVHELGARLADPALYQAADGVQVAERLSAEVEKLRGELDQAYAGWTRAAEAVEQLGPE
jgi:ATP-binding cassette subfamily F protein 3